MATPVILYDAGGKVIGPQGGVRALIQFYRPPSALDGAGLAYIAQVIAFGAEATATAVGSPIAVSDLSFDIPSVDHMTTGRYGESNNDPTIMRSTPTLNLGTFIQSPGQPTLMPGDFTVLSIAMKVTSTSGTPVPAPSSRWVIGQNGLATTGPNKWSLRCILDRTNSDPTLIEF